jgi:YHS domain-containing protein
MRQAKAREAAAGQRLVDRENTLLADVELALYHFRDADRKIALYRKGLIPKARESLQVNRQAFESGKATFLDVIDAERDLLEFELSYERAQVNRAQRLAELEMLVGKELSITSDRTEKGKEMKTTAAIVTTALVLGATAPAEAAKKAPELKPQTVCPVMGGKINKDLYLDHKGQRIYVCCAGCLAPIKKDPAKYIKKMAEKGEAPTKIQTVCPVMGGKINKDHFAEHDGKRIYVCCPPCIAKIKADPDKYVKKMKDAGITLDEIPKKK